MRTFSICVVLPLLFGLPLFPGFAPAPPPPPYDALARPGPGADLLRPASEQVLADLWPHVEVVLCHETADYACPICLEFPAAARVGVPAAAWGVQGSAA